MLIYFTVFYMCCLFNYKETNFFKFELMKPFFVYSLIVLGEKFSSFLSLHKIYFICSTSYNCVMKVVLVLICECFVVLT